MNLLRRFFIDLGLWLVLALALVEVIQILWMKVPPRFIYFQILLVSAGSIFFIQLLVSARRRRGLRHSGIALGFWLLFACYLSVAMQFTFSEGVMDRDGVDSFDYTISMLNVGMAWFFAGSAISLTRIGNTNILALAIAGLLIGIVASALRNGYVIDYEFLKYTGKFKGLSHLSVAEYLLMLMLFAYAVSYSYIRYIILVALVAVVFVGGGRSSLFFGALSPVTYEIMRAYANSGVKLIRIVPGILVAIGLVVGIGMYVLDFQDSSVRKMLFLEGIGEDSSAKGRLLALEVGLKGLPSQIPFGDPNYIVREFGAIGAYIHSLLSAWQFFGFLPFILFVYGLYYSLKKAMEEMSTEVDSCTVFFSVLLIYVVYGALLSKSVGSFFLWLSLGYWLTKPTLSKNSRRKIDS